MFSCGEEFEIEGIKFNMTDEHFFLKGRGDVYIAMLGCSIESKDFSKLIGKQIKDGTIAGIESFATMHQGIGRRFGLLIRKAK